jgi:hypothetical protein
VKVAYRKLLRNHSIEVNKYASSKHIELFENFCFGLEPVAKHVAGQQRTIFSEELMIQAHCGPSSFCVRLWRIRTHDPFDF